MGMHDAILGASWGSLGALRSPERFSINSQHQSTSVNISQHQSTSQSTSSQHTVNIICILVRKVYFFLHFVRAGDSKILLYNNKFLLATIADGGAVFFTENVQKHKEMRAKVWDVDCMLTVC